MEPLQTCIGVKARIRNVSRLLSTRIPLASTDSRSSGMAPVIALSAPQEMNWPGSAAEAV